MRDLPKTFSLVGMSPKKTLGCRENWFAEPGALIFLRKKTLECWPDSEVILESCDLEGCLWLGILISYLFEREKKERKKVTDYEIPSTPTYMFAASSLLLLRCSS